MLRIASLCLNLPEETNQSACQSCHLHLSGTQRPKCAERTHRVFLAPGKHDACANVYSHLSEKNTIQKGNESLVMAVSSGFVLAIELFLRLECDPNAQNEYGETPLHEAVKNENPDFFNILLNNGANPTIRDASGQTPVHMAVRMRKINLLQGIQHNSGLFSTDPDGNFPIHVAIYLGYEDIFDTLTSISEGLCVNVQNTKHETPLIIASTVGSISITKKLLGLGAMIDSHNDVGCTALHVAAYCGHRGVYEALISNGANTNIKNLCGQTPFDIAPANWFSAAKAKANPPSNVTPDGAPSAPIVLDLKNCPAGPLPVELKMRKRPLSTLFCSTETIPFHLETSKKDSIVVRAIKTPIQYKNWVNTNSNVKSAQLESDIRKVTDYIADFSDLKLMPDELKEQSGLRFVAYENYGNSEQKVVGFTRATPVNICDTVHSRKLLSMERLLFNAGIYVNHPKAATTWEKIRNGLCNFFTYSMGTGCRKLSDADLEYIASRMKLARQLTNESLIETCQFQGCCWDWLWCVTQLLSHNPIHKMLWNMGYIHNLQAREEAEKILNARGCGTMLIRLSGTELGVLVVGKGRGDGGPVRWLKVTPSGSRNHAAIIEAIQQAKCHGILSPCGKDLPIEPLLKFASSRHPTGYTHVSE